MKISLALPLKKSAAALMFLLLAACTPGHDWRDVRGTDAPFVVLMPAKPSTLTRQIDLDGTKVTMTMTAAEVGDVTYAVGSIELADADKARLALQSMKIALVKNISGTVLREKSTDSSIDIDALGAPVSGQSRLLVAHFVAKNKRAYQVIATGPEKAIAREQVDTFLTSFKLE